MLLDGYWVLSRRLNHLTMLQQMNQCRGMIAGMSASASASAAASVPDDVEVEGESD